MLEKEIKFIHDFSNNYIRELGLYFTVDELKNKELHPALIRYISAEVDYRIFQDRRNLLKNSAFDYSGEKINEYFNLIKKEIKRSKRFSANQIDELLYQAVEFNANFLMQPRKTLLTFFFGSIDILTTVEIKQLLNYLYYYRFLVKIIKSYFKEKDLITISKSEFEKLLEKIDAIGIETHLDELIETAVNSMTDFFNIGMLPKEKIPLIAIDEYLAEKNLNAHRKKLREAFHGDVKQTVLSKDVLSALKSVVHEKIESIGIIEDVDESELVLEKVEEEPATASQETAEETAEKEKVAEEASESEGVTNQEELPESEIEETIENEIAEKSVENKITPEENFVESELNESAETEAISGQEEATLSSTQEVVEENLKGETISGEQTGTVELTADEKDVKETVDIEKESLSVEEESAKIEQEIEHETEQDLLSIKEELEERKIELKDFIQEDSETGSEETESLSSESSVIDEIDNKIKELSGESLDAEPDLESELDLSEPLMQETESALDNLVDADIPGVEKETSVPQAAIIKNEITEDFDESGPGGQDTHENETLAESEENDEELALIFNEFDDYFAKKLTNIGEDNIETAIKNYAEELDFYIKPLNKEVLEQFLEHSNIYDGDYMIEKINLAEFLTGESEIPEVNENNLTGEETSIEIKDEETEGEAILSGETSDSFEEPETEIQAKAEQETVAEELSVEESGQPLTSGETVIDEESVIEETVSETGTAPADEQVVAETEESQIKVEAPDELLNVESVPQNGDANKSGGEEQTMDEEVLSIDEDSMLRKADEIDLDEFERNSEIFNTVMEYETEPEIKLADEFSRLELKPDIKMSIDDELIAGTAKEKQTRNAVKEFILMNNLDNEEIETGDELTVTSGDTTDEKQEQEDMEETYTPPQYVKIDLDSDEKLEIEDIIHSEYMPRIIEVVFDYDMIGAEDLMNELKGCGSKEECDKLIDRYCEENKINPSIPEVQVFKSLVARTVSS